MLCSATNITKLKVPEIPKGGHREKEPWPIKYTKNTAVAAATGVSQYIHDRTYPVA
jgi:hypothetical protein